MIKELIKVFSVKKTVTIMVATVFCYLSLIGIISAEQFLTVCTMVFGTYFGHSIAKKDI